MAIILVDFYLRCKHVPKAIKKAPNTILCTGFQHRERLHKARQGELQYDFWPTYPQKQAPQEQG